MKKRIYFILSMIIMVLCLLNLKPITSYAFVSGGGPWGNATNGVSTTVDPTNPRLNIDPDTVQIGQNPNYTTYKVQSKGTTSTFKASEIPSNGKRFILGINDSVTITYAGSYKGDIVDAVVTNVNSNNSDASMILQPNGSLSGSVNYKKVGGMSAVIKPSAQFKILLKRHSNNTILYGVPILLNQSQPVDNASYQNTVGMGFDSYLFRQLYGISENLKSTSIIYYQNQSQPFVVIEMVKPIPSKYTYYGRTDGNGIVNLYASSMMDGYSTYNVFDSSVDSTLYPISYTTTNSEIASTTTDAGKFINISTTQLLAAQKQANFYPINGSMELVLNESNIGHLLLNENDFTLSTESSVVSKDNYQLAITYPASGKATITIKLLADFASKNGGKILTVSQKSTVNPDQNTINSNLIGNQLPVTISTTLNYKMSANVQTNTNMSVITNSLNGLTTVVPELTAKLTDGYTVNTGTTLYDIPIEELVRDMNNTYFPWDEVSAGYQNANQTLTTGANKVNIVLKSDKFNYTQIVTATVNVTDGYKLTYDGNGGTLNGQTTTATKFTKAGTSLMDGSQFVRKGYTFTGWSTTANGAVSFNAGYNYGALAAEQKDTTLYACWKKDEHKLTYNGNGGTIDGKTTSDVTFTIDGTTLLDKSKVVRKGYTFTGWSTTATGAMTYQAGYVYGKIDAEMKDTILYARWEKDEHKLTYNGNGGIIDGKTTFDITFTIDGTTLLDKSKVVRKGYTFTGWSTTPTGAITYKAGYVYGKLDAEMKDTTLYACWKKDEYKLTYNGNGGTVDGKDISDAIPFTVDGLKLLDGSKVIRKGYIFTGWSTTATGTVTYQAGDIYGTVDTELKDTILYACWEIDKHTLTYNGNGGTIDGQTTTEVPFTIEGIKLIGAANVARENYTFLGWSTSPTDSTKLLKEGYIYGTSDEELKDTTLYACWEETTRITVSWNADKIETSNTEKVDRADNMSTMSFYWNSNKKETQYLIKQKVATQQTDLKKIIQEDDTDVLQKDTVEINTEKLAYGDNQMTIEFYQLDATGKVLTSDKPDAILNLTITINGSLRLESVPNSLDWTNRLSESSVGILDRDTNNDIELSVIDSRENQSEDWSIQANLTMVEDDIPFGFVWKNSASSSDVPMNEDAITIMDKNSADKKGSYEFSQTWNDKLGVLLQSHKQIPEGNYSGKVVVNWTITEGPI